MSFTDRKLEIAIIALSITVIGGLGYVLKTPVQNVLTGADIVYEMPRIKKSFLASLFDLGDREIDRSYTNPFAKKKAEEAKKKAEEAKKAQAAAAKAAAAKTAAKKAEDAKKAQIKVTTIEGNPTKKWGDDGFFGNNARPYQQAANNTNTTTANDAEGDTKGMTGDQWLALLRAQPTSENVNKLIQAFANKEVDAETYYAIVADLYRSNKSETQALGLQAAKAFYSVQSFMVTTQFIESFTPEVQTQAHSFLKSYAVSGRLGVLASVLQSSDVASITMATEVVLEGYQNAKNGTNTNNDPRNSRGNVVTNSVTGYAQFSQIYDKLTNHSDPAIQQLAINALAQLPQGNVVASM